MKENIRNSDKRFSVRRTPGRGLGLFSNVAFKKGDLVLEYTGEKIPTALADTLTTRYLFEIDEHWTIDGSARGNIARYINHSCDANCETEISKDDKILITAVKKIWPGDELSYDYGDEYFDEFLKPLGCRCGSKKCKKPAVT
jgi:SET domain-containing protein